MLGFIRTPRPSEEVTTRRPARPLGGPLERLDDRIVPTIIANADFYQAKAGTVLSVTQSNGVLVNDYSDTGLGSVLTASLIGQAKYQNSGIPLPSQSLNLKPNGTFTFITPNQDQIPINAGPVVFTYSATNLSNAGEPIALTTVTISIQQPGQKIVATGADAGGGPHVRVYDTSTGVLKFNFFPYEPTFTGGVRVAVGDVNNDGVDDIVTIPASGGAARLKVFSGRDGSLLIDQFVFDAAFRGGGFVAVGDYNGDGRKDVIVGAGEGGGPRVSVFTFNNPTGTLIPLADFFAYSPDVASGVRVAAGDLYRVGRDNLITAPGPGGGPQVNVYDGVRIRALNTNAPLYSFFAGDANNRDGVNIATGNFRGDGRFDILTGTASGPGIVRQFDGRNGALLREFNVPVDEVSSGGGIASGPGAFNLSFAQSGTLLAPSTVPFTLIPGSTNGATLNGVASGGVTVAATDWNQDGLDDFVIGAGRGNAPRVRILNASNQSEIISLLPYSTSFLGGVNVAASPTTFNNLQQPQ
jgi:hypothetical protein